MPTFVDHCLVMFLLAVVPIEGQRSYRMLLARLANNEPGARSQAYRATIIHQWLVAGVVLGLWWWADRPLAALGLVLPIGWRTLLGALISGVGLAMVVAQWRAVKRLPASALDNLRAQAAGVSAVIPRTGAEAALFRGVAVTAGICEEVVYRGFLMWYCARLVGPLPALPLAAGVFGMAHYYQGKSAVLKTGLVGMVAGTIYMVTGSLLWPIVLHVAVDLQGGAVGRTVLGETSAA